jgi:hypothetical protein
MPPLPGKKLTDPILLARNKLRMSFNSLDKVAEHLGVNSKTELRPEMWLRAALDGDRRAMSYTVEARRDAGQRQFDGCGCNRERGVREKL